METTPEPITDYLKRRLKEVGSARFERLAARATKLAELGPDDAVVASFIRKFFYGSRENPRVQTIQPLLDYFAAVDRGEEAIEDLDRSEPAEQEQR